METFIKKRLFEAGFEGDEYYEIAQKYLPNGGCAGGMMNQWYFQIRFNELLTKDYEIEDIKEILEKKYEELEKLISTFSY